MWTRGKLLPSHSILSYNLCFGQHVIILRYAHAIKQQQRVIFEKKKNKLDMHKII